MLNSTCVDENMLNQKDNIEENNEINSLEIKKQIKIGFLFLSLLVLYGCIFVFLAYLLVPENALMIVNFLNKIAMTSLTIFVIIKTIKKWNWNLSDWGFSHDLGFWIIFIITFGFFAFSWYAYEFQVNFDILTIQQALTGFWEELIFTVFLTFLLIKTFQIYLRLHVNKAKILAVLISALIFTLIHLPYGRWTIEETISNMLFFIVYRILYAFIGSFFFGMVIHGISGNQYMAFPLLILVYAIITFIDLRSKRGSRR